MKFKNLPAFIFIFALMFVNLIPSLTQIYQKKDVHALELNNLLIGKSYVTIFLSLALLYLFMEFVKANFVSFRLISLFSIGYLIMLLINSYLPYFTTYEFNNPMPVIIRFFILYTPLLIYLFTGILLLIIIVKLGSNLKHPILLFIVTILQITAGLSIPTFYYNLYAVTVTLIFKLFILIEVFNYMSNKEQLE